MKKKDSICSIWGTLVVAGMALSLLVPGPAFAATIVIDDMTVQQGYDLGPAVSSCVVGSAQTAATTGPPANIYGQNRVLEVTHTVGASKCTSAYVDAGSPKYWAVANPTDSTGWGRIVWSGSNTIGTMNLPPLNLSQLQYFNITRVTADHPTTFYLEVWSDLTHGSRATIVNYPNAGGGDSLNVHVLPGAFGAIAGVGADFSSIKEIRIFFNPFLEIDTGLRGVSAVTQEPPAVYCGGKTLNGQANLTTINPPPYDLTVAFSVVNSGGAATTLVVEDTMPLGMVYTGSTTCDGGFLMGNPTFDAVLNKLTWNSSSSLAAGASVSCSFPVVLNSLDLNQTKWNLLKARASSGTFGPEECQASITRREGSKVPSLNEWGALLACIILAAAGIYLVRRKREA